MSNNQNLPENEQGFSEDDILYLTGDNGEEIAFYHEATVEYEGEWYVLVHPKEKQKDISDDEILIMHLIRDDEGEDMLEGVDDMKLLEKVYEVYIEMVEEYNKNGLE